jgi:hypothetical protein
VQFLHCLRLVLDVDQQSAGEHGGAKAPLAKGKDWASATTAASGRLSPTARRHSSRASAETSTATGQARGTDSGGGGHAQEPGTCPDVEDPLAVRHSGTVQNPLRQVHKGVRRRPPLCFAQPRVSALPQPRRPTVELRDLVLGHCREYGVGPRLPALACPVALACSALVARSDHCSRWDRVPTTPHERLAMSPSAQSWAAKRGHKQAITQAQRLGIV